MGEQLATHPGQPLRTQQGQLQTEQLATHPGQPLRTQQGQLQTGQLATHQGQQLRTQQGQLQTGQLCPIQQQFLPANVSTRVAAQSTTVGANASTSPKASTGGG